ncbi:MAG: hypothetical protein JF591_22595, partial [Lysobacter sp.]|nr:hypothetical protein [Lysobacter sp.]
MVQIATKPDSGFRLGAEITAPADSSRPKKKKTAVGRLFHDARRTRQIGRRDLQPLRALVFVEDLVPVGHAIGL